MALKKYTLKDFIMALVAFVWSIAAVSSILTSNSIPLGAVTPVMMIVVGFLFRYHNGGAK